MEQILNESSLQTQDSVPIDIDMTVQDSSFQNQIHLSKTERKQVYQQIASAAFYDKMMESMIQGDNEEMAEFKANAAVNAIEFELETLNMRENVTKRMGGGRKTMHITDPEEAESLLSPKREKGEGLSDQEEETDSDSNDETEDSQEEDTAEEFANGKSSAQNALGRLQSAMNKIKGNPIGKDAELQKCRDIHRQLMMLVTQYDKIMELANQSNLDKMTETLTEEMLRGDQEIRTQMERRINHKECEAKISNLSQELVVLKHETSATLEMNHKLSMQVHELKLFKSNAENESKLMLNQLTRRKIKMKSLVRKLNAAQSELDEIHRSKEQQNLKTLKNHSNHPSDTEYVDSQTEKSLENPVEHSDMNQTIENTQTEDEDMESLEEKDLQDLTLKSKPKWNTNRFIHEVQTTSSIMHQDPESEEDKESMDKFSQQHHYQLEQDAKLHKKCVLEFQRLKRLLAHERAERKKVAMLAAKKSQKTHRVIQMLHKCMQNLSESEDKEQVQEFLQEIQTQKHFIQSLLVHVQQDTDKDETDAWSASEKVTESKKSRPSSAATTGFYKERPQSARSKTSNATPIVPIVLKEKIKHSKKEVKTDIQEKPSCQKLDSVSCWMKKIGSRPTSQAYSKHGLVTADLISTIPNKDPIKKETERNLTRPTSARTTASSVRFAPSVDMPKKAQKRPSSAFVKSKTAYSDF